MQPTPDRDISPPNSERDAPICEQPTDTPAGARSRVPATSSLGWGRSEFLMVLIQLNSAFAPTTGKDCGMSTLSIRCPHRGVDRISRKNPAKSFSTSETSRSFSSVQTVHTLACLSQTWACGRTYACEGVVRLGCGQVGQGKSTAESNTLYGCIAGLAVQGSENRSVDSVDRVGNPTGKNGDAAHA